MENSEKLNNRTGDQTFKPDTCDIQLVTIECVQNRLKDTSNYFAPSGCCRAKCIQHVSCTPKHIYLL